MDSQSLEKNQPLSRAFHEMNNKKRAARELAESFPAAEEYMQLSPAERMNKAKRLAIHYGHRRSTIKGIITLDDPRAGTIQLFAKVAYRPSQTTITYNGRMETLDYPSLTISALFVDEPYELDVGPRDIGTLEFVDEHAVQAMVFENDAFLPLDDPSVTPMVEMVDAAALETLNGIVALHRGIGATGIHGATAES